jgi:hypothetical protein
MTASNREARSFVNVGRDSAWECARRVLSTDEGSMSFKHSTAWGFESR